MTLFISGRRLATAALLAASTLTPAVAVTTTSTASADTSARRMCAFDHSFVKKTQRGSNVWMPTSRHWRSPSNKSGWQQGGSQGYSETQGKLSAKSKGSADTVEGGGSIGLPGAFELSGKYNHQWNRSTTATDTTSRTYSSTVNLPSGKVSRMRVYQAGVRFTYTYVIVYEGGPTCKNKTQKRTAALPIKASVTAELVELYSKRGKLKPR